MFAFGLRRFFGGLIIAAAGALIWADNPESISLFFRLSGDWPLLMVGLGLISMRAPCSGDSGRALVPPQGRRAPGRGPHVF